MFEVVRYSHEHHDEWNAFVAQSKNGTFLFDRRYMDYHADRFQDASLMLYEGHRLFAVLPANRVGDSVFSHQGLSYGGLILGVKATAERVCKAFDVINNYYRQQNVTRMVYKALPSVYALMPSDEPLYALHVRCHARLVSRDVASVVCLNHRPPLSELRRRGARKAQAHGISIAFSDNFAAFWQILENNLQTKYQARPVHTLQEIELLRARFPENIILCAAFEGNTMLGGTVLYKTPQVVKTQYISASPRGKELGALDLLFKKLMDDCPFSQPYFDMGTSAMDDSNELRLPLIFQKEGFGGRAICYDTYEWTL